MDFKREVAGVLSTQRDLLWVGEGTPARVDFPTDLTWKIHKAQPGFIYALAHSHPPGVTGLSEEDKTTCKAWAYALSPFPIRMIVLTEQGERYLISTYLAILEALEFWGGSGRPLREFKIVCESAVSIKPGRLPSWGQVLMGLSYKDN